MATAVLAAIAFIVVMFFVRDKRKRDTHIAPMSMQQFSPSDNTDEIPVSRAMNPEPYFVTNTASIREVAQIMVDNKASGVPIVDHNKMVVGFISDGDIMKYIGRNDASSTRLHALSGSRSANVPAAHQQAHRHDV